MVTVTSLPLYLWDTNPVIMKYGAQWAPETVRTFFKTEKSSGPTGIRLPDRRTRSPFAVRSAVSGLFVLTEIHS